MAVNLSIKSVPDELAERLRARAERNHRSLQGELMAIIERAALTEAPSAPSVGFPAHLRLERRGTKTVEQVAAELRARHPTPFHDLPRAVDIVRKARDSRYGR